MIVKALLVAAALVVLLWFLAEISGVLLLFFFAVVLGIVLSAPVTWMERRRVNRAFATLLVFTAVLAVLGLLGWLVVPRVLEEGASLVRDLPTYVEQLQDRASRLLDGYPALRDRLPLTAERAAGMLPSLPRILGRVGSYSISVLGFVAVAILVLAIVVYAVAKPRPLLAAYLRVMPPRHRPQAARAFARASTMVVGWMWSNIVVGTIEAVAAGIFLSLMDVPGALVWAALTFFAELVPKLGPYLMALPPTLVALATDPMLALWVALFYLVMNELMGDVITPRIRASTMNIHPVAILFVTLAMAAAFGLPGALIATPIAGFAKAYYEEFYLAKQPPDPDVDRRVEAMLDRRADRGA